MSAPHGRAIIDLAGLELSEGERTRLMRPEIAGVILFARNYRDSAQLRALVAEIRSLRPALLLCVDHEGGRVQRFREGFTSIPAMRSIGKRWDADRAAGLDVSRAAGYVIGTELSEHGIDFSFAPVLDLDFGCSQAIGDRAFHRDPEAVGELAAAFISGLAAAGMAAVGKHFPGHGFVQADSHHAIPIDERPLEDILREDVLAYRPAIRAGLAAVMPAHVVYSSASDQAAGYSSFWLTEILRRDLGFDGLIFSDDLHMEGAAGAGSLAERAHAAIAAGCDMVLLCNDPAGQETLLDALEGLPAVSAARIARMRAKPPGGFGSQRYLEAAALLRRIA